MYPTAFIALINNQHIWIAILACASAQAMKVLFEYAYTKKINRNLIFSTGGMPSSHSALVVAMAASIGSTEGLYSPIFAVAFIFALIVMHDAAGVRRAAGKHAVVINNLIEKLKSIGITPDEKLKELLGHSPIEVVAGALWGIIVAATAYWIING